MQIVTYDVICSVLCDVVAGKNKNISISLLRGWSSYGWKLNQRHMLYHNISHKSLFYFYNKYKS